MSKIRKIKFVCNAVRWFDKVNGNTYHSVNVTRLRDGVIIYCDTPYQYGYGEHYRQTALELMLKNKWIPKKYGEPTTNMSNQLYLYDRENDYPIMWNVTDGLKREMIRNGTK